MAKKPVSSPIEKPTVKSNSGIPKGLPQLNKANDFIELTEIINTRAEYVAACYMDKLLLNNTNQAISQILEGDWQSYAKNTDNHFFNNEVSKVKKHIKFREERGWIYDKSGDIHDPVVRLVGYKPQTER